MPAIDPPERKNPRQGAIDHDAIERLEHLIETLTLPQGGLLLESIDGLFCAAQVSPGAPVALEELLPLVLGPGNQPDDARLSEAVELLRGLWAMIARRIAEPVTRANLDRLLPLLSLPELDEKGRPLLDEEDADFPFGAPWALGFALGYRHRLEDWNAWLDQDDALSESVFDIFALMPPDAEDEEDDDEDSVLSEQDEDDAELDDEDDAGFDEEDFDDDFDDEPLSIEERLTIIADLPELLNELHTARVERLISRVPVRREQEPGRNDPCPCGSGQKYKKCHGDPARPKN